MNSQLKNKSEIFAMAAEESHKHYYYPAVAHSAYYCCYQLIKHIWLYSMKKTDEELYQNTSNSKEGSHEVLIRIIGNYIKNSNKRNSTEDFRNYNTKILELKRLRIKADYKDTVFNSEDSSKSLSLSNDIIPILKKY